MNTEKLQKSLKRHTNGVYASSWSINLVIMIIFIGYVIFALEVFFDFKLQIQMKSLYLTYHLSLIIQNFL